MFRPRRAGVSCQPDPKVSVEEQEGSESNRVVFHTDRPITIAISIKFTVQFVPHSVEFRHVPDPRETVFAEQSARLRPR